MSHVATPRLEILFEQPRHRAYAWDALVIGVLDDPPAVDTLTALHEAHRRIAKRHAKICSITVLGGEPQLHVSAEARQAASDMARELRSVALAGAVVVPAVGLKAAFLRSVITGVHLLARSPTPNSVFASMAEAVRWICQQPGQSQAIAAHEGDILAALRDRGLLELATEA